METTKENGERIIGRCWKNDINAVHVMDFGEREIIINRIVKSGPAFVT